MVTFSAARAAPPTKKGAALATQTRSHSVMVLRGSLTTFFSLELELEHHPCFGYCSAHRAVAGGLENRALIRGEGGCPTRRRIGEYISPVRVIDPQGSIQEEGQ